MTQAGISRFSTFRSIFWPIHRWELKKFLPMFFIYSLIVFNYSILRAAKDALLITAPGSGAEALPYIKVWAILPMAFLSTLIFTRLANRYSREKIFYIMMWSFISFFFVFAFILYPAQNYLHPHAFADKVQAQLPLGLHGLVAIFRNWTFTLFYVMSELWGTIIMSVLFWGFANEVTSVREAKRFYAILGVGANLATVVAGQIGILLSSNLLYKHIPFGGDRWGTSLIMITVVIIASGLLSILIYKKLARTLSSDPVASNKEEEPVIKMGIRKNFAYLAKSKYLLSIAVIVLTFNISLNMIEIVWKDQLHQLCPYAADYNIYMGKVLIYIGIVSTLFSVFLCGQVVRRFGWTVSAYITPVILLVTGIFFFFFVLFKDLSFVGKISAFFGVTPLFLSTLFGSMQNCFSRASKFSFFDVTKEMAFIPLSKECKLKGKAAIDGVGSRLGKSGGALIHECLLLSFGTIAMSTPYVAGILFVTIFGWIVAVRSLGRRFNETHTPEDGIIGKEKDLSPLPSTS
ncbi:MAG: NTP/NDP exchange transporter [Verrucomicrobia bacterium]|nr:NTP/NDP exchange transporter [Verrucomicrobiota bacterium]